MNKNSKVSFSITGITIKQNYI